MESLRRKLALSYGPLIVILIVVSAWGVYNLVRLGRAVDVILVDNYKSIQAASSMKEAVERQNAAALLCIGGYQQKAVDQFKAQNASFEAQLQIAGNNITEPGEDRIVADIRSSYSAYKTHLEHLLAAGGSGGAPSDISVLYFQQIQPESQRVSQRLDDLLQLNQEALFNTKRRATDSSRRAQWSTGILAVAGLVLAIVFAWGFIAYVVNPVRTLAEKARLISEGDFNQHIDIKSRDEIGALAAEFNRMAVRLRDLQKSDYSRLLMEKKKSDAVINCIREPVIVTDAFGTVTKLNDAAVSLVGDWTAKVADDGQPAGPGSDAGMRILKIVHDSVSMQRPVSGKQEELLVPVNIGGAEHNYRLRTAPMRDEDGRLLGSVTLLEDTTGMMEAERVKGAFIEVAGETLRSPLDSLRMALYTLAEGHVGELSDSQADMLKVARENADQLDETVNDLLEIASLDSRTKDLKLEDVRPVDVVRPAVARQQPYAEANRVALTNKVWSDLPKVRADKRAMKLIFDNLLSNAIRHTPHEGEVTLEAWERNNLVFFSVKDTGEGIPEDYLSSIFASFTRIPGRKSGGTGLGLALVKRLVNAQDGQISIESNPGEGTTVTFALPVAQVANAPQLERQIEGNG